MVAEVTDDKSLLKHERKRLQVEHAAHISKPGKACEANGQDLQPAGRCELAACRLVAGAEAEILRLGTGSGGADARHASGLQAVFDAAYAARPQRGAVADDRRELISGGTAEPSLRFYDLSTPWDESVCLQ